MNRSEAGKLGYEKTQHILKQRSDEKSRRVREEYEADPKFCQFCGTKIDFEKRRSKFCNHSCSAKYNNRGVTRHIKGSKICSCGNPKKVANKYCSECIEKHVYSQTVSLEEAKTDRTRKMIIMRDRPYRCEVCGISDWMGKPINLELDHIDGNSDNNQPDNLRLICPNCHALTVTYKGANAGKNSTRQQMRRKRYADGKTY